MKEKTIFERIGGIEAVDASVRIFYSKVLEDDRINHFFKNTNITVQVARQKKILVYVSGAPVVYTGNDMRSAHAHLVKKGLNESHFDAVTGIWPIPSKNLAYPRNL